jgi:hydrogenase expression/formation protein HypC
MCLAIPGKVISISGEDPLLRLGRIDFSGVVKEACLAYVPEAKAGDFVIVHAGFALSKVDEAEAQKIFEYLRQMDEPDELKASANEIPR